MFKNRTHAAEQLAALIDDHDIVADIVLAIPRGGLPVGRVVADSLGVPLDVVVARKLGAPWNPEFAIGAVASDGTLWLNEAVIDELGIADADIAEQVSHEQAAAQEKLERYRAGRPPLDVQGQTVLLVDDGIATGATTTACLRQLKQSGAARVTLAVPVAPPDTVERLHGEADAVLCVETPPHFDAVGQFYESFEQVSDAEAKSYLKPDE